MHLTHTCTMTCLSLPVCTHSHATTCTRPLPSPLLPSPLLPSPPLPFPPLPLRQSWVLQCRGVLTLLFASGNSPCRSRWGRKGSATLRGTSRERAFMRCVCVCVCVCVQCSCNCVSLCLLSGPCANDLSWLRGTCWLNIEQH